MIYTKEKVMIALLTGGWQIIVIEPMAQGWYCHIATAAKFETRVKHLKESLRATILTENKPNAEIMFPLTNAKPAPITVKQPETTLLLPSQTSKTIPVAIDAMRSPVHQLLYFYHRIFDEVGDCHLIDEQHFAVTFKENVNYPVKHPFVALLSKFMPDIVPVLISTEVTTDSPVTTFYFAPVQQRAKVDVSGLSIYVDGSFKDGFGAYGVQYLMSGEPIVYRSGVSRGPDSFSAELMALLEAVSHIEPTTNAVTLHTDSLSAIHWLQTGGQDWWAKIVTKIPQMSVQHIPREQNTVAHRLAYNLITKLVQN